MPPKGKKESEEEAKRLEEEQRKKEEEEARLALERKRYAPETLPTSLGLPASSQLILDIATQPVAHCSQKLRDSLLVLYPSLSDHSPFLTRLLKQLLHEIITAHTLFSITATSGEEQLLKARVYVGIVTAVMVNQHESTGGAGKDKRADEGVVKQLVGRHVSQGEGRMKIWELKEVEAVLEALRKGYFSHFRLFFKGDGFAKRQDVDEAHIYVANSATYSNRKDTPFTDLAPKQNSAPPVSA